MIEIKELCKQFEYTDALQSLTLTVNEGQIFGLVGTNGSGKTTLMKLISGIIKPERGEILVDGEPIYENIEKKRAVFYIADDAYFPAGYTGEDMKRYYKMMYPTFDEAKFHKLMLQFGLDANKKISSFSKGMKKQVNIILGLSANTKYVMMDETFDGLDPVMRQAVKSLLVDEICKRNVTPIIASHNLRELEDICDHVGILHKGKVLVSEDMDSLKMKLHRVQCLFAEGTNLDDTIFKQLDIQQCKRQGALYILTIKGERTEIEETIESVDPVYYEMIPLSLEEMFISETEVAGYAIKDRIY